MMVRVRVVLVVMGRMMGVWWVGGFCIEIKICIACQIYNSMYLDVFNEIADIE